MAAQDAKPGTGDQMGLEVSSGDKLDAFLQRVDRLFGEAHRRGQLSPIFRL
jgi:hypothetical protein